MKYLFLASGMFLFSILNPIRADNQPTAFEKALYDKARYHTICRLGDDDFVSYCATMNLGGSAFIKINDDILSKQVEVNNLIKYEGIAEDNQQVAVLNKELRNLRAELAIKVSETRRGLEIEAKVAEETLAALQQYQK